MGNIKNWDEFSINESITVEWLKTNMNALTRNQILSFVNKNKSLTDEERELFELKRDIFEKYPCVDKDGIECDPDIKKPYKIFKGKIISIPSSDSWTPIRYEF